MDERERVNGRASTTRQPDRVSRGAPNGGRANDHRGDGLDFCVSDAVLNPGAIITKFPSIIQSQPPPTHLLHIHTRHPYYPVHFYGIIQQNLQ